METNATEISSLTNLTLLTGEPKTATGDYAVTPEGAQLHDLEPYQDSPRRIRAMPHFTELASFIRYLNDFKAAPARVFVKSGAEGSCFLAVLDYHTPGCPDWCQHKAVYPCPKSVEWATWMAGNCQQMRQWEFATFLRNNLVDIVNPSGAQMLEIALTLQAKKNVDFSSAVRLDTGDQQLKFTETTDAKAGQNGTMQIPELFQIGIAPFQGGAPYAIDVRLNHRIQDGKLTLWYEVVRPHKVIEEAVREMADLIKSETGIAPLAGAL